MGLTHFEIHKLERRIAKIIEHGFSGKMDPADSIQAGHDIADMLLTEYAMEDRDALLEEMGVANGIAEAVKNLRRLLAEPRTPLEMAIMPAVRAAGVGGGVGEEVQ
jgi:hypothetical protein